MEKFVLKLKALVLFIYIFFSAAVYASGNPYVVLAPDVSEEMLGADYWIEKASDPYKVRMSTDEIYAWNNLSIKSYTIGSNPYRYASDLRAFDKVMIGQSIRSYIQRYNPKVVYYKKDSAKKAVPLGDDDYKSFYNKMNYSPLGKFDGDFKYKYNEKGKLTAQSPNTKEYPIKKAVAVKRCDIKLFPTDTVLSSYKDYWYDDANQASAVLMNEPVLVLWTGAEKKWVLVKTAFVTGWTRAENIAYVSDSEFERYFDYTLKTHEPFVTVTADRYKIQKMNYIDGKTSELPDLFMGTYLHIVKWTDPAISKDMERTPHGNYAVQIPIRKSDGNIGYRYAAIPCSVCNMGLVPFTQANTLRLLFNAIGNPYGWGGQSENRDCSGLSMETFRCFGFIFGRNSLAQASMPGKTVDFRETTDEEALELCRTLPAGTLMYFKGHIFMYIGFSGKKPYFISATGAYVQSDGSGMVQTNANSVIVNSGDLLRNTNETWLSMISYAKLFEGAAENLVLRLNREWKYADYSKINSGSAVLYKAPGEKRKNITVALNASHGTRGGESVKVYYHPDKSAKENGKTQGVAVSSGMKFKNGNLEEDVVLRITHLLKTELLECGYDVLMLRDYQDVQLDYIARTLIANHNADIQITIHYDEDEYDHDKGVFYYTVPENLSYLENVSANLQKSNMLGDCLIKGLKSNGMTVYSDGTYEMDNYQACYSTIPCAMIELGNQHSSTGYSSLRSRVLGLLSGINAYFGF